MSKTHRRNILTRLIKAYNEENENEFLFLLEKYSISSDTDLSCVGIDLSILEHVLQTSNSSGFINICLNRSASLWKKNPKGRYLFFYAVSSMCANNIEILVNYLKSIHCEQKFFYKMILTCEIRNSNNYLHDVIEKKTDLNQRECLKIVDLLLKYGCSPNHLNAVAKSPFEVLLDKFRSTPEIGQFIELFKDVHLEIEDSKEYRNIVQNLSLNNVNFRSLGNNSHQYLLQLIQQGNEDLFAEVLKTTEAAEIHKNYCDIWKLCIDMNFSKAITKLPDYFRHDISSQSSEYEQNYLMLNISDDIINGKSPLSYAVSLCRHEIVKVLLNFDDVIFKTQSNSQNILHEICSLTEFDSNEDFEKCFDLIIQDKRCTVELINSFNRNHKTPLMLSCENNHKTLQHVLIERGAYIGHESVIESLNGNILVKYLDESMIASADINDHNCIVKIDYNFLIPPRNSVTEMEAIQIIASKPKFKNILTHPVLMSFVELKWKRVNLLLYATILIYFLFFVYMSAFFLSTFNQKEIVIATRQSMIPDPKEETQPGLRNLKVLSVIFGRRKREAAYTTCHSTDFIERNKVAFRISTIGTLVLTVIELVQMFFTWKRYLFKLSNWVDCAFLGLAYVVIFQSFGNCENLRQFRAVLYIVIAVQSFIILGRISKLSMHLEILKKVMKTFLKFMFLYFMLIFAFAMAFYTIYGSENQDSEDNKENNFQNILISTITVIRMMLSDFDGININPDDKFNAAIFLTFVLLITIILFNLLNALAIADTQQIMISAEIVDVKKRIRMIMTCERILAYLKIDFFNIYSNQIPNGKIYMNINQDCFVRVKKSGQQATENYVKVSKFQQKSYDSNNLTLKTIKNIEENSESKMFKKHSMKMLEFVRNQNIKLCNSTVLKIINHLNKVEEFQDLS